MNDIKRLCGIYAECERRLERGFQGELNIHDETAKQRYSVKWEFYLQRFMKHVARQIELLQEKEDEQKLIRH